MVDQSESPAAGERKHGAFGLMGGVERCIDRPMTLSRVKNASTMILGMREPPD